MAGDLTDSSSLGPAVEGIDAVVFTHGAHSSTEAIRGIDYGGVRAVLEALGDRKVRIALMTAIDVTSRAEPLLDWKRRSERLVRASGHPYTIVRLGWFDMKDADRLSLHFLQRDRRWAGSPADGVIARAQITDVLVDSLTSEAAEGKTFELVAEHGPAQEDLDPLFAALTADGPLDPPEDTENMPLEEEPAEVREDLERVANPGRPA